MKRSPLAVDINYEGFYDCFQEALSSMSVVVNQLKRLVSKIKERKTNIKLFFENLAYQVWLCLVSFERVLSAHVLANHLDPVKLRVKSDAHLQLRDQLEELLFLTESILNAGQPEVTSILKNLKETSLFNRVIHSYLYQFDL